jgi:hypothetical protein
MQRRYPIVIAAIVFAVLTWVSVNMAYEYMVVRQIPIVLENRVEGKALRYPIPKHMTLWFRGNGWMLAGLLLSPDVRYTVDMSSLGPEPQIVTRRNLFDHIKLPVNVQVIDTRPDTLVMALEDYREKRVPVISRVQVNFREGYGQIGPMRIEPDSITIGGGISVLEHVNNWNTSYRRLDDVSAPIDLVIPLEEPTTYSITLPSNVSVHLRVNVQAFAEKTLEGIPIVVAGVPADREVILMPARLDIIARGGIEQLARLTPNDFRATITYQTLVSDSVEAIKPTIVGPEEVRVVSQSPEFVRFVIRKRLPGSPS